LAYQQAQSPEITDCHFHHHAGREAAWRPALETTAARNVAQLWVSDVPWASGSRPDRAEVEALNAFTLRLAREHPGLVRGMVYADPRDERRAMGDMRRAVEEQGMIGVKLWCSCFCDEPCVFPIAAYAQERRLPVLVHAWDKAAGNLEFESSAAHVAALAARFPELPVIMAHHGGDWIHACRRVAPHPRVFADVSGSIIDHGLVDWMVAVLGPERVLFGTDNADFFACRAKVAAARIGARARRLIFSGNARRILEGIRR
jgi:hypothetical protein